MKKILFVINTLSRAGAETAFIELLSRIDKNRYEVDVMVLTGIGEMRQELPEHINLINRNYSECSILTKEGRGQLNKVILKSMLKRASLIRLFPYLVSNFFIMLKKGRILPDKLLWRVISDGSEYCNKEYDIAVAYLEGGSTYYVADHVKAVKKVAFVHVDYNKAGYTRKLDRQCYLKFDKIYTVSSEVESSLIQNYPEVAGVTEVFSNIIGKDSIIEKSKKPGGFNDSFEGTRILTIGRLTKQKAFEVSIEAMKLLKDNHINAKWYVLGEGDQRGFLEGQIKKLGLKEDFILLGKVDNPYPYLLQTDLYVHASKFEGKSIAIQEARILGCPVLVTDCEGNREQVKHDIDGRMCDFDSVKIAENIMYMIENPDKCKEYGRNAAESMAINDNENERIEGLLNL